ncbi:hypothetical protein E2320_013150 [Naja naja]|nr:hypothetical protein E2320_013150 [Naja naja]
MEVPGAGEQEPGAAAAAPSEKIDLSLDDIIKRNQAQPNRKPWRHQLKTQNPPSGNRRPRFQSWGPPSLPGSSRFPKGFRKPPWARKPFWSRMSTPGPRAAGQMQGRSPLNRPAFAQQDKPGKAPPGRNGDGAPPDSQPKAPARAKAFKTARTPLPFRRLVAADQAQDGAEAVKSEKVENAAQFWSSLDCLSVEPPGRTPPGTSVTLDERFSGLRHKHHFSAERNTSRMVTLP